MLDLTKTGNEKLLAAVFERWYAEERNGEDRLQRSSGNRQIQERNKNGPFHNVINTILIVALFHCPEGHPPN